MFVISLLVCFVGIVSAQPPPPPAPPSVILSACGSLMMTEGIVTSVNWPDPYPATPSKCVIKVRAPISHTVSLTLQSLDTKISHKGKCNKKSDKLAIYDGPSANKVINPLLAEWCGDTVPAVTTVETSKNEATITFRTQLDPGNQHTGYKIDVRFVGDCGMSKYNNPAPLPLPPLVPSPRIYGGVPGRPYEFPWMVVMYWQATNDSWCGASILNKNWIMCAGHCVGSETIRNNLTGVSLHIHVNDKHDLSDVKVMTPLKIIIHPRYNLSVGNVPNFDIALFKVPDMTFDDEVMPVCLPNPTKDYVDRKATVIGWGRNDVLNGQTSALPYYTTLRVITDEECQTFFPKSYYRITRNMMCSTDNLGNNERDTCRGDSGGPMVVQETDGRFHVVGITSWGFGCATGTPGVYTRVSRFLNWIQDTINTN